MSLVQKLSKGLLDIIGDVHGEYEALINLIILLGYDMDGNHPNNRKLVFVGDLCDRGPNSPAVILFVKNLVEKGNAQVILGNHELNLLQNKPKDGAGWYFEERFESDTHYTPFQAVKEEDKEKIYNFLVNLPIALENDELRIVHAAWQNDKINQIRNIPLGEVANEYLNLEKNINAHISTSGLLAAYRAEQKKWDKEQVDPNAQLPFLEITSEYNVMHQMMNPLRVLTSGVEKRCEFPFYASGKWRFVERCTWWNDYTDDIPVIVGHFWRRLSQLETDPNRVEVDVFEGIAPLEWHGAKGNVYCVDYSVGGRFVERNNGVEPGTYTQLVALRWPERELMLENGQVLQTIEINEKKKSKVKKCNI